MIDVEKGRWRVPRLPGEENAVVPTAVHLEQFVPLLLGYFGAGWWQRGRIAVRAVSATVAHEPVRCYLEGISPSRCRVWMNAEGEALILEGSAAVDEHPAAEELVRGWRSADLGAWSQAEPAVDWGRLQISGTDADARLPTVTEPIPCYRDAGDFGARVAPLASVVAAVSVAAGRSGSGEISPAAERFQSGIALDHLHGPVLCDREYRLHGRLRSVAGRERHGEDAELERPDSVVCHAEISEPDRLRTARIVYVERPL